MRAAQNTMAFPTQWLNRWPASKVGKAEWPEGWSFLPKHTEPIPTNALAAVEIAPDRSGVGWAVVSPHSDHMKVSTGRVRTPQEAFDVLVKIAPSTLLVGLSLKPAFEHGPWILEPVGMRETRTATPWLADAVKRGLIHHDHNDETAKQARAAKLVESESGIILSAKRSRGAVDILKAVSWACWYQAEVASKRTAPAVW